MNRLAAINSIRQKLAKNQPSIGSWIQIPHSSIAEIMGGVSRYDWIAVDMEHGSISTSQLPDIFRALELTNTLPLARIAQASTKDCKMALDAGAGGIIVPMIETKDQLSDLRAACCWPPAGTRGVGFCRANLYGNNFKDYQKEALQPLVVAMIENIKAIEQIDLIASVPGLDAIMVGPYDLSASMGITADFENIKFTSAMTRIKEACLIHNIPFGIHVVSPNQHDLKVALDQGYTFVAHSIDSVFLSSALELSMKSLP